MTLTEDIDAKRVVGPVTRTDFVRYAGAGGDFNPLHHDDEYARNLGLPSVFGMGMWTAGLLASFVGDWIGVGAVRSLDVRFRSAVWPGDELILGINTLDHAGVRAITVTAGEAQRITGTVRMDDRAHEPSSHVSATSDRLRAIESATFDDVEFRVERGKIMEFARAVRSTSRLHYDVYEAKAAGFPDLVAPLTFGNTLAHWSGGDASDVPVAIGLELSRVVHGEQRYRFDRAMIAGEVLTARRRVGGVAVKPARTGGDMTLVTVVTDFSDQSGVTVVTEEMVMIEQPPKASV